MPLAVRSPLPLGEVRVQRTPGGVARPACPAVGNVAGGRRGDPRLDKATEGEIRRGKPAVPVAAATYRDNGTLAKHIRGPGLDPAWRGKGPWNGPQTCGFRVRTNVGKDKAGNPWLQNHRALRPEPHGQPGSCG